MSSVHGPNSTHKRLIGLRVYSCTAIQLVQGDKGRLAQRRNTVSRDVGVAVIIASALTNYNCAVCMAESWTYAQSGVSTLHNIISLRQ